MANMQPKNETEESIKLCLTDMQKIKGELKEIKKSIRNEKKNDDQDYKDLKKQIKGLNKQAQQMQIDWEKDLKSSDDYNALLELKRKSEEKFAQKHGELQKLVAQLPHAPIQLSIETELGKMMVNVNPEMKVYVNGKEEKRNI
jgi:hypothetical protein